MKILALGDSYTVGEGVPVNKRWVNIFSELLQIDEKKVDPPTIIAQTGWTSDTLLRAVQMIPAEEQFDLIFLMIGVNDQYDQLPIENFRNNFRLIIEICKKLLKSPRSKIISITIPDWTSTPYASGLDKDKKFKEILEFNQIILDISREEYIHCLNITELSRINQDYETLLIEDQLHPSGNFYEIWADYIYKVLRKDRVLSDIG